MAVLEPDGGRDEAGAEELAALATVLRRPAHVPAPREDDEDGEDDELVLPREEGAGGESPVLPRQRDEFTCGRCFLVAHVSRRSAPGCDVCRDCG